MQLEQIKQIFREKQFHDGRMIGFSKSGYSKNFPKNEIYFNASIFTEKYGKIWWGDIDLTKNSETIQEIADELGLDLFILSEFDSYQNENKGFDEIKKISKRFFLSK